MTTVEAYIALHRFGLGGTAEQLAAVARDPRGWVRDQIGRSSGAAEDTLAALPDSATLGAAYREMRQMRREAMERGVEPEPDPEMLRRTIMTMADQYATEATARTQAAAISTTPFTERLVHFWSNHFTVSATRPQVTPIAGAYEREAIRPNIYGRFEDLVMATARHPAMLLYLDNAQSVGPNSLVGRRRERGLNENYARELLELHTLGVGGGYSQTDVIELAKILTGWTVDDGGFVYRGMIHEPGAKTLLGQTYRPSGEAEGIAAIRNLARHPATANFVATKLARHFIADDPPQAAVDALARRFRETGGDLAAVYETLIDRPEAWRDPGAKVKTPNELLIAALRAFGTSEVDPRVVMALREMGQQIWRAPSPQGWPDRAQDWIGPQSLLNRISVMQMIAERLPGGADIDMLAEGLIGPVALPDTLLWISRAPDIASGGALLLASAEFQGR